MADASDANEYRVPPGAAVEADDKVRAALSALLDIKLAELFPPLPRKNCGNCRYWNRLHMVKSHGQCMLSAKGAPAPAITPDLARCSGWED